MLICHHRNTMTPTLMPQGAQVIRLWDSGLRLSLLFPADPRITPPDWSKFDAQLASAESAGQKVIYVLGSTPPWAQQTMIFQNSIWADNPLGNRPPTPDALATMVSAIVTRYKGKIWALETLNEFNAPVFSSASMAQLAVSQYVIWTTAKAIDPNILITTPTPCYAPKCLYPTVDVAMQAFLAQGIGLWDVMTFHGYQDVGVSPLAILPTIQAMQALTGSKPLWDTEFGPKPADTTLATADAERLWALNAWIVRKNSGLGLSAWYCWDHQTNGTCQDRTTGVITPYGQACIDFAASISA